MGQSRGPFKGNVWAQKSLQGSKTVAWELLEGTELFATMRTGCIDLPYKHIHNFYLPRAKGKELGVSSLTCECIGMVVHSADSTGWDWGRQAAWKKVVNHGVCTLTQLATMAKMQAIMATLQYQILVMHWLKLTPVPKSRNNTTFFVIKFIIRRHFHEWLKSTTKTSLKTT